MGAPAPDEEVCVLVVDDDEGVRETLREVVEMAGCSAMVAGSGEEALALLATVRPCMIILDLLMPTMSGVELLEVIRARPELASLPVLISTSAPGLAPAGIPVLSKPLDIAAAWVWMRRSCRCPGEALRAAAPAGRRKRKKETGVGGVT
jgi:CheY-like chemotaxis protein